MTKTRADFIDELKNTIDHYRDLLAIRKETVESQFRVISSLEDELAAERSANKRRQGFRIVGSEYRQEIGG